MLARRSLLDVPAIVIALVTLGILLRTKKVPEPILIMGAAVIGIGLRVVRG